MGIYGIFLMMGNAGFIPSSVVGGQGGSIEGSKDLSRVLNPKPKTLNPKPKTLNVETPSGKTEAFSKPRAARRYHVERAPA